MRVIRSALLVLAVLVALPLTARAQAAITGTVKDSSGAVLPGVTVEAASPALIEKVRSAVTDGTGQYRIVDLRPGTYSLTFALQGFNTVKRDGIELTGTFTASINAEMRVGGVAETITVSGETPVVDVASTKRQTTLSSELLTTAPTARSWAALTAQIPTMTTSGGNNQDIQVTPQMIVFGGAGGRGGEGRLMADGISIGSTIGGGGSTAYIFDISNAEEVVTTNSGGLGESEVNGPSLNVVPRTGGNSFRGSAYLSGVPRGWVGSNYTDDLKAAGLRTPGALDQAMGLRYRVRRARSSRIALWYFITARDEGQHRTIPGIYPNLNAGDPTKYLVRARHDEGGARRRKLAARQRPSDLAGHAAQQVQLRLERADPVQRRGVQRRRWLPHAAGRWRRDWIARPRWTDGDDFPGVAGLPPHHWRAFATVHVDVSDHQHAARRLPLRRHARALGTQRHARQSDARPGAGHRTVRRGMRRQRRHRGPDLSLGELAEATGPACTTFARRSRMSPARTTASSATSGRCSSTTATAFGNSLNLTYRVNNGVPNGVTETALPMELHQRTAYNALFAQEQWTIQRMTLQGALRFDRSWSYFAPQTLPASNYLPFTVTYPETEGVRGYKDLTPRFGVAYDLFGNAKTALKVNIGKYLEASSNGVGFYSTTNPINRLTTTSGLRTWNDANGNFIPDCDLLNMSPNRECGQGSTTFGKEVFTSNVDPAAMGGWRVRPSDWGLTASVQQEVLPRVSVEVGYTRRWLQHFVVTDNLVVTSADFGQFSVTAPSDSRLPGRRRLLRVRAVRRQPGLRRPVQHAGDVQRSAAGAALCNTSATTASRSTSAPGRATGCCSRAGSTPGRR